MINSLMNQKSQIYSSQIINPNYNISSQYASTIESSSEKTEEDSSSFDFDFRHYYSDEMKSNKKVNNHGQNSIDILNPQYTRKLTFINNDSNLLYQFSNVNDNNIIIDSLDLNTSNNAYNLSNLNIQQNNTNINIPIKSSQNIIDGNQNYNTYYQNNQTNNQVYNELYEDIFNNGFSQQNINNINNINNSVYNGNNSLANQENITKLISQEFQNNNIEKENFNKTMPSSSYNDIINSWKQEIKLINNNERRIYQQKQKISSFDNSPSVYTKAGISQNNINNINSLNKSDIFHFQIKDQKNNLINQNLNQRNSGNINVNNEIYNNMINNKNNNNRNPTYLSKSMNLNDSYNSDFMNEDELIKDFEKNYILINGQYVKKNQMNFLDGNRIINYLNGNNLFDFNEINYKKSNSGGLIKNNNFNIYNSEETAKYEKEKNINNDNYINNNFTRKLSDNLNEYEQNKINKGIYSKNELKSNIQNIQINSIKNNINVIIQQNYKKNDNCKNGLNNENRLINISPPKTKYNKNIDINNNINNSKEKNIDKKAINSNKNNYPDKNDISDLNDVSSIKIFNQDNNFMKNDNINNLDNNKNNPNFNNIQNANLIKISKNKNDNINENNFAINNKVDEVINKKDIPKFVENQKNNCIIENKKYKSSDSLINMNKNSIMNNIQGTDIRISKLSSIPRIQRSFILNKPDNRKVKSLSIDSNNDKININNINKNNLPKIENSRKIIVKDVFIENYKNNNIQIEQTKKIVENKEENSKTDKDNSNINLNNNKLNNNLNNSKDNNLNKNDINKEQSEAKTEIKSIKTIKKKHKRPVYKIPPSKKDYVSQGNALTFIFKYYDENFIMEEENEDNEESERMDESQIIKHSKTKEFKPIKIEKIIKANSAEIKDNTPKVINVNIIKKQMEIENNKNESKKNEPRKLKN